ncbi:hypothetical protein ACHAWO_002905 [Cyclotella atomus]|uniref:Uncharacterized protein n=1 Tax=Cyclotella atomus TaxID=382360 RepID=A0ABD3NBE6_9STRA
MPLTEQFQFCSLRLLFPLLLVLSASYRLYDEIIGTRDLTGLTPYQEYIPHQPRISASSSNAKKCQSPGVNSRHVNYTASFLHPTQWMKGEGDIYSGMWWQSIDSMLLTNYSKIGFLEAISFQSFRNNKRVIQTVDWLDVAVEHLSKYVKFFSGITDNEVRRAVEDRVAELIEGYIRRTKERCPPSPIQSAIPSTIAILPLRVSTLEKHYEVRLLKLQLTATIASLWVTGFPRAVIVGVSQNESLVASESFELLHDVTSSMELKYIHVETDDLGLVPKVALTRFQQLILQLAGDNTINNVEIEEWFGQHRPSKWKHVYFTEPDLILHIRPEATQSLSQELDKGHIINAHRLQPLPHTHQFSDIIENISVQNPFSALKLENKVLPNKELFALVHSLNPTDGDVCCDQGKFYPGNLNDSSLPVVKRKGCWLWEFCGFGPNANHSDWNATLKNHELLLKHPFISLVQGTQIPLVHHGQRVCIPRSDGTFCSNVNEG